MSKNDYLIRLERKEDYPVVENLIRESFWNVYRPGCLEHYLITKLREHSDFVKELDFVMEKDGEIIGQNVFVKANIKADDGRNIPILTMGPICITPELKRQGYGKILLDYSIEKATELGYGALAFLPAVESIEIAEGVTEAGYGAFAYNLKLTEVNLPDTLQTFGFGSFAYCSALENIDFLPKTVTRISDSMFSFCDSLTEVVIPENITFIEQQKNNISFIE